jgi:hypothetical protein
MFALAVSFTSKAAPMEQRLWRELAAFLQGKSVTVTTKDGQSISGRFFAVRPDGITFSGSASTTVPRDTVLSLHWEAPHQSETHKLGKMLSHGYRHAGKLLGTPMGPFALAELPVITAWGAAATPFCLLGDLFAGHPQTSGDISILPDSPAVSR